MARDRSTIKSKISRALDDKAGTWAERVGGFRPNVSVELRGILESGAVKECILEKYGIPAAEITVMPQNPLSRQATTLIIVQGDSNIEQMKSRGIRTIAHVPESGGMPR